MLKLRALIDKHFDGKAGHFADKLGKQRPIIYRLFTDAQSRKAIGDSLAREIEEYFQQKPGWLDEPDLVLHRDGTFVVEPKEIEKPRRMSASFRKEVLALLQQMTPQQREAARAHMRQLAYENVISLKARQSTMSTTSIRVRSEGRRTGGKSSLHTRRLSDNKPSTTEKKERQRTT